MGSKEAAIAYVHPNRFHGPKIAVMLFLGICCALWLLSSTGESKKRHTENCPLTGTRYGIMFDAGSTGSRVHVFEFFYPHDATAPVELKHELFEEVKPGLSSYKTNPTTAADSLLPLLRAAMKQVPPSFAACTPIALKATAGLRLLGKDVAESILDSVYALFAKYPFALGTRADAVMVMDGKDEGPYAWLTVNFLLGTIGKKTSEKTAAIIDMGGASTQIVFIPDDPSVLAKAPAAHVYETTFRGVTYRMYQHSHLGLGLKEAIKAVRRSAAANSGQGFNFPCLPVGAKEEIKDLEGKMLLLENRGTQSDFDGCKKHTLKILQTDADCSYVSCSFNGVYQPHLAKTFSGPIFAFSYFYDRMEPYLPSSGVSSVGEYKRIGKLICEGSDAEYSKKNVDTVCHDFVYLYSLLSTGYRLEDDVQLQVKKKINGIETAWALGAMIVALG